MNFMRSMVKEIEALTDSAVHATRQGVEGVAQAGKETVEGISQLANSALDEATAALETVSNMGEATLSLISNTMRPSKRRFHPLKPNIMRCACIGDSGVGKSTLLATWREGRYPAGLDLPSTIYDWLYFNYCLSSKSLLLEHLQQHRKRKANDDDDDDDALMKQKKKMEIDDDDDDEEKEKENMKEIKKEAEEAVATVEAVKERREIVIEFLDTAGEYEGFRHLRPWHYKDVDVFILAFDVTNRASFANIARYWTEEIKTWGTSCVKILVGTKADIADEADDDDDDHQHHSECDQQSLFGDDGETMVAAVAAEANRRRTRRKVEREEAEQLAKRVEAVTYVEISSVTQLNLACLLELCVAQVFEDDNENEQEANDKPSVAETTTITELTTTSTGL